MKKVLKTKIIISKKNWRFYSYKNLKIHLIGYFFKFNDTEVIEKLSCFSKNNIIKFLKKLDGNFSIIIEGNNSTLAVADRINSYPLTYARLKNEVYISDNGLNLVKKLKFNENNIDYNISTTFAMSGYTVDNNTIFKGLKSLLPGQFILITKNNFSCFYFYLWQPWKKVKENNFKKEKIFYLNEKIIKKLIKTCDGRQIILPLSAGWDSRFIASGLKHFKYNNVICVTYGRKNSNDMKIAKKLSESLGFKWIQVIYNKNKIRNIYNSKRYKLYKKYCDNLNSIHFMGEYLMLSEIKQNSAVDKDAIIVNGQSGDFITGNHIPIQIGKYTESLDIVLEGYISKHNKYWKSLLTLDKKGTIKKQLKNQIYNLLGTKNITGKNINMFGIYETLEFYNRQVKYVINGTRNYEFFNFEWRMPLWDFEYMRYWEKAPFKLKFQQNYYKKTLKKTNWGNVWKDIGINPKKKIAWYYKIIRFIFKSTFFLVGKEKWYMFERKYIEYFIDDLHNYSPWRYMKIFFDKRQHYSSISWYIAEYLEEKKVQWDGEKPLK